LKREVENLALNVLVKRAAALGLNEIRAEYIPTAKNGLVKNLFAALGFQSITQDGIGHSLWRLPLHGFSPLTHQIIERGMDA
jgi:predicted enzyme involved in methoxymalonyl-ACP biosynthesis